MGKTADDYADKYTEPRLRADLKEEIKAGDKGGKPGQWSARKSQLLVHRYEEEGGGYRESEEQQDAAESLRDWTEEDWQTRDGSAYADKDGEPMKRYLPDRAWDLLSDEEKERTAAKKRDGGEEAGRQFVENTIEAKAARAYVTHGDASDLSVEQLLRLTRKELEGLARDADLSGRSKMDKDDLAHALNDHFAAGVESGDGGATRDDATRDELYEEAKDLGVDGRSKMDKAELRDAVEGKRS